MKQGQSNDKLLQQNNKMEIAQNSYQNSKNRKRLIAQNNKLFYQVISIQEQLRQMQPESSNPTDSSGIIPQKSILEEIAMQEKLIRKLRGQIQQYKLERAKDNVEYIIREEDQLKMARKIEIQLQDQKRILLNKKADKSIYLQKDVPYQNYQKQFLQNLTQVVHLNREQAAKITEIQRQIRKYHLIKKAKSLSLSKVVSAQNLVIITKEIQEKVSARMNLERQWKPHFVQLDEEHATLLRQLGFKKQQVTVLEKQQKIWQIRLSAIRQRQDILSDKERLQKISINPKLRQSILDYIKSEEEKKKKKVNQQELKYQFVNKNNQSQKSKDQVNSSIPPLPETKKKDQKVVETMHNDKNISKKIDKSKSKKSKNDQNIITQISVPSNKQTVNKIIRQDSLISQAKTKLNNQQRSQRLWLSDNNSQMSSQKGQEKSPNKKNSENPTLLLKLKEIGITTEANLWDQQIIESVVQ